MRSKHARRALATALLLSAIVNDACAQTESPTLADRLSTMDAQLQLLRKQFELDQALSLTANTSLGSLPRVVAVYGFAQDLQARLMLPSGMVSTYREGDVIRGSMKVIAITPKSVMVSVQAGRRLNAVPLEFIAGVRDGQGGTTPLPPGMPATGPLPPELLPPPPVVGSPLPARARPPISPDTGPVGATGAPVASTVNNPAPRARQ
jgi:type IV pilus biogenesis protein PilP